MRLALDATRSSSATRWSDVHHLSHERSGRNCKGVSAIAELQREVRSRSSLVGGGNLLPRAIDRIAVAVALSIPAGLNAHTICFSCHTPQAESNGRNISSCSVCHEPGRLVRTYGDELPPFGWVSAMQSTTRPKIEMCCDCHRVRAGLPRGRQVTSPVALNHHAPARASSCMTCHNGKRAFGGDDFSVCTRCHKGSAWHF